MMLLKYKLYNLIKVAAFVAGLVVLQQLIIRTFFGNPIDLSLVPQLTLANLGIVFAWLFFRNSEKRLPAFLTAIAVFCFALWLHAVLIYIGTFRIVAPLVIAFVEKQIAVFVAFIAMPQVLPAAFAAIILLMLLPKAKEAYKRIISNGAF